jgi:hypothetical protein
MPEASGFVQWVLVAELCAQTMDFGPLDPGLNSSGATRGVLETGCICESPVSSNITTFGEHPNMHRLVSVGGGSTNYLKKKGESIRSD